ncbi:two component transcriptional regulator, LytTR family [Mariniphaga anaerophila]|uniref:Two component transcriptional regulator, LytTR family n=1 Tax=Mariniphaga anaerophila TaxID=1484053 RepID=A0A1M5D9X0_9BACT|nr:LytTR family DNA-binding domain-containing protein [Mariniphaga anaerophila]SHF63764.1 two component transcriptional regulator, LytTR family [Mariniphaga anaerophila]
MEIKALVVDDEPLAQNVIEQYAKKLPNLQVEAKCNDAICAHQVLQNQQIDLIFLDINMPKLSGISFLKNLKNAPLVIFTTAYSEYALEGFELDAVDYLKKPFGFERFCKAFYKAEELLRLKNLEKGTALTKADSPDFIFIKSNKKTYKVNFAEICFIEGLGDYIQIHLTSQKIVANLSMKKIVEMLPADKFYRIHKSFIISLDNIELIEGNSVVVNKKRLPIGSSYRQEFMEFISENM